MKSEFGKGLCYCLGMFLEHAGKLHSQLEFYRTMREKHKEEGLFTESSAINIWFNGASDHFYDLQWEQAPKHLRKRCKKLMDKSLDIGHGFGEAEMNCTVKDAHWAIKESKDLLRLIDKSNGISVERGSWE